MIYFSKFKLRRIKPNYVLEIGVPWTHQEDRKIDCLGYHLKTDDLLYKEIGNWLKMNQTKYAWGAELEAWGPRYTINTRNNI